MKYIHIPTFIISLGIGFFLVYIITPPSKVIYVYPNTDNIKEIQYTKTHHTTIKYDDSIYIDVSNKSTIYYFLHSRIPIPTIKLLETNN